MHDAQSVRIRDADTRLKDELHSFLRRERAPSHKPGGEILALQKLHHDVGRAAFKGAYVDYAWDVLTCDSDHRRRLEGESGHGLRVVEHGREQKLERHFDTELHVPCGDHDSHPADSKNAFDLVLAR